MRYFGREFGGLAFRLKRFLFGLSALLVGAAATTAPLAPTPPMGWNSWDAYGFTISEAQFKANVALLAKMKPLGWNTAVIDEGWYMANPLGDKLETRKYLLDGFGRLMPVQARFPSAADGKGLKGLADWTHAQGLKFGIHIVRGIPKAAVEANMPIEGSHFRAADAADRAATCPWDDANYGIADNEAGQAYYDSLLRQYAGWGVDFLKVDCIADHPYRPNEIRQIAQAIRTAGRPIILSLSPGPTNISHAAEVKQYAQMWRIMDDMWDAWTFPHPDPTTTFPNGIRNAFEKLAEWNSHVAPGSWPDADMLPFGSLFPHAGWGEPRRSRLTQAETRTAFTLWSIARSPLILGGNLTEMDDWLQPLLTNRSIIALNQGDRTSRPVEALPADLAGAKVWISGPRGREPDTVAIFNVSEAPLSARVPLQAIGLAAGRSSACDLWSGRVIAAADDASVTIAPHDVTVLQLGRCAKH
jgi:alpha-galactosidase